MSSTPSGLLDRTFDNLLSAWRSIIRAGLSSEVPRPRPDLPDVDAEHLRRHMHACLVARGGEVSARARAAALGQAYLNLNEQGRQRFLGLLAREFSDDEAATDEAMAALASCTDDNARRLARERLRAVLTPPYLTLLTQFNSLPDGVRFLVDLRADVRRLRGDDPALHALDRDLRMLLASWFDVGFLDLRRLDWNTPASLLERLIAYEAVHEIQSWDDLKHRLGDSRRCYAYFHPRMPDEPLIFVQVALVTGMSDNIQAVLDQSQPAAAPGEADTAIFYSISNTQLGLHGVGFGAFLIKRVVDDVLADLPGIRTCATLSPVPGFRRWFEARIVEDESSFLRSGERAALAKALGASSRAPVLALALATPDWPERDELTAALQAPLVRACARYLVREKREGRALDRVAHFHLGNGARVQRINWMGDASPRGMDEACGMMVNYLYDLRHIERNHEAYHDDGQVPVSSSVQALLKGVS